MGAATQSSLTHNVVSLPPGPRKLKDTLSTKVGHLVEPYLQGRVVPAGAYKETIGKIDCAFFPTNLTTEDLW